MEKLKSLIPRTLREMIAQGTPEDLASTCSSLHDYFLSQLEFHTVIRELSDPGLALCAKNKEVALDLKKKGNRCFSSGDYRKALSFYSQALRSAPVDIEDADNNLVATLYINRASTMHKMGLFIESIRDCNRAIILSPCYVKAWYRRGKANASLENYKDATHDMNVALSIESSLVEKNRIKDELRVMRNHHKRTSDASNKTELNSCDGQSQIQLQCISTTAKGRGMVTKNDIPPGFLVHSEEPYAAILLKDCREIHCHFCFRDLPADTVPCSSCTIALYCSQHCQHLARGNQFGSSLNSSTSLIANLPVDLKNYIADFSLKMDAGKTPVDANLEQITEHGHECGGVHWPAVLPPEIVLAARILVKFIDKQKHSLEDVKLREVSELCHNYIQMAPESKLEMHIYAIVLAYCLQHSFGSNFQSISSSAEQLVIIISKIKVNSMAVVHMRSLDRHEAVDKLVQFTSIDYFTSSIEQVKVGQAIYLKASLFNHSCEPNIHAYFLSRTLFLRSTEFVPQGSSLELSYGPQVGQWDLNCRQELLESQYSFKCQCSGCTILNISDLVINAFQCMKPNCHGAVVDFSVTKHANMDSGCSQTISWIPGCELALPIEEQKEKNLIDQVAHLLLERIDAKFRISPGYCLSCCTYCDLESSRVAAKNAGINITRLQDAVSSKEVAAELLSNALRSLNILRTARHAYSKDVAQAEDSIAEALCSIGELQAAMHHCKASIEIIERLYHSNHIVVANELVKLASIQLSLNDHSSATNTINRLRAIFTLYYGSHYAKLFPYLENLWKEEVKITIEKSTPSPTMKSS